MQFTFEPVQPHPDLVRLEQLLADLDPAALLDLDPSGQLVRMSTSLPRRDVLECLLAAGLEPEPGRLRQLPSQCCGGCSG